MTTCASASMKNSPQRREGPTCQEAEAVFHTFVLMFTVFLKMLFRGRSVQANTLMAAPEIRSSALTRRIQVQMLLLNDGPQLVF